MGRPNVPYDPPSLVAGIEPAEHVSRRYGRLQKPVSFGGVAALVVGYSLAAYAPWVWMNVVGVVLLVAAGVALIGFYAYFIPTMKASRRIEKQAGYTTLTNASWNNTNGMNYITDRKLWRLDSDTGKVTRRPVPYPSPPPGRWQKKAD